MKAKFLIDSPYKIRLLKAYSTHYFETRQEWAEGNAFSSALASEERIGWTGDTM